MDAPDRAMTISPGRVALPAGHVFRAGHEAQHGPRGPPVRSQLGQSFEHAEHGGRAGHIAFHFGHARRGLDADASAVEGDAFAHQHHGLFALRTLGDIFQHHQPGLLPRAAATARKAPIRSASSSAGPKARNFIPPRTATARAASGKGPWE